MSDASIAAATGIPVSFVGAIRAVESGGDPSAVRFEPHVFWRIQKGLPGNATGAQIYAALSVAELAQVPYTPGKTDWRATHGLSPCHISRAASCSGAETNAAAFQRAYGVAPTTAVRATSFGSFQVLGGDLLALYANNAAQAVAAFRANPVAISDALLIHFLNVTKPRAKAAAIVGDVPSFVSAYNGCSDCSVYIQKFNRALHGGGSGGGIIGGLALALGAAALWKWLG